MTSDFFMKLSREMQETFTFNDPKALNGKLFRFRNWVFTVNTSERK